VELEFESQFTLITEDQTSGWVARHFDLGTISAPPNARRIAAPTRTSSTSSLIRPSRFSIGCCKRRKWLRNIAVESLIDYMASGLPNAGDEVGGHRYFDDASRRSFSVAFVVGVAPW
jgi:hypothetical protein